MTTLAATEGEDYHGIEDVLYTPWPYGIQYEIKRHLESVASSHQSHRENAGVPKPANSKGRSSTVHNRGGRTGS